MTAISSPPSPSQTLERHIAENRAASEAFRNAGRDADQELRALVRQMFDAEALVQTFNEYEAHGYHWSDAEDDDA